MEAKKLAVFFPELDDPVESKKLRVDAIALATKICEAVCAHLKSLEATPNDLPNATSVGVACYVASYLIGESLDEERKAQIAQGLTAAMLANSSDDMRSLASLPTEVPN